MRISRKISLFEGLHRDSFNRRLTPPVYLCKIINSVDIVGAVNVAAA